MPAFISRAIFSLLTYAVFFAPLGLIFLLFTFLILLLPTYAWGWIPTLTSFLFGALATIALLFVQHRKEFKAQLSLNQLLLAGAFPGACCGFVSTLIQCETGDFPLLLERGFA
jgi:hypothetical protein